MGSVSDPAPDFTTLTLPLPQPVPLNLPFSAIFDLISPFCRASAPAPAKFGRLSVHVALHDRLPIRRGYSHLLDGCCDAGTDDFHDTAATLTAYRRTGFRWRNHNSFEQLHQFNQLAIGMQKSEVARAAVSFGQNVLKNQAQECHAAEGAGFSLSGLAVLVTERHPPLVAGQNIFLLNHAPIQITPQIDQGLFARADFLAVNHPIGGITARQFQPSLLDPFQHLGAEHFRQRLVIKQIPTVFVAQQTLFFVERGSGHHQMHMRMEIQPTVVSMQYRHRAGGAPQLFVMLAEGVDRPPRATGDQVIHRPLVVPGQRTELGGQGERDHEVIAGNQLFQLLIYPALRLMCLTMRAMAMPAGMWQKALLRAVVTGKLHLGTHAASARLKGV